ncbi:MAG: thioredoxin family protein [Pseudoflavonifractor sp.]
MELKILGGGCAKCNQLEAVTRQAVEQLGLEAHIDHVTDFSQIAAYGVMSTPALVAEGKVLLTGRVPKAEELAGLLRNCLQQ